MKKPIINPGIIKRLKSIFAIVQDGDVATRNIASGKYVLWKNVPCHASSAITTGDTLAIGTNLTADNDGFINALHDGLSAFSGKAIANNLTTETAGYVLDARQGKALNDSVASLNDRFATVELWVGGANELAPGKISIPTISQYDEIGIAHNFDGSGALLIEHFKYASGQGGSIANLSLDTGKSGTAAINYCTRGFTLESDGITFQSGNMIYNNTLYTGWNNRCVPKYIYGIKH